jgi:hypothetical protein
MKAEQYNLGLGIFLIVMGLFVIGIVVGVLLWTLRKYPSFGLVWQHYYMIAIAGAVALYLFYLAYGYLSKYSIHASGLDATAVVQSIKQTNTTINNQPVVLLQLNVQPQNAAAFTAKVRTEVPMISLSRLTPGARVAVRYSPSSRKVVLQ